MRWIAVVILALLIGRPAAAQTPKAADLVGQWRRQEDTTRRIVFGADSTFTFVNVGTGQPNGGKPQPIDLVARWHLAKDTLAFIQPRLKMGTTVIPQSNGQARQVFSNDTLRLVTLRGRVLTMKTRDGKRSYVYERVGADNPSSAAKPERNNPLVEHS